MSPTVNRLARIAVTGALAVLFSPTTAFAGEGCLASGCHAKLLSGKTIHSATESCDSCHESTAASHPQKGKKTFKLAQEPPALCATCHDEFGKKGDVHSPVKEGQCTTCHDPHSSNEPKLLVSALKELCGNCHDDHLQFKVTHGPVSAGSCTVCHNPHESDQKPLLRKPAETICFDCHLEFPALLKKADVHPALESGCTSCHNPHGSGHPNLLADTMAKVCFDCHSTIEEKVTRSPVGHPPVKADGGCVTCHSPHAEDNAKLLVKPMKELCLGCHPAIIKKNATVLHGPVAEGKCVACHEPHGSQNQKLLVRSFPAEEYVAYSDTEFPLCFGCHKRELVQYPETSFATNFRDGERNLHFVHVNKPKARSCRFCHEIHAGPNPKLIADSVTFGKWDLPLKYVKTDTGGGCSPGCHKPQYYDRKTPGKKPEPADPKKKG